MWYMGGEKGRTVKLTLVLLCWGWGLLSIFPSTISARRLNLKIDNIQISGHSRDYRSGPLDGRFLLTTKDAIHLFAGELPTDPPSSPNLTLVRRWTIFDEGRKLSAGNCDLMQVYDFGRRAVFTCPKVGTYVAFAQDFEHNSTVGPIADPELVGFADNFQKVWTHPDLKPFLLPTGRKLTSSPTRKDTARSEAFEIAQSEFCYYWNYRLREISRIGYVFRETDHLIGTGVGSTYISVQLEIWVSEPGAVTETERNSYKPTVQKILVSSYSKIITKKVWARGLYPCLRRVHPSVELASKMEWLEQSIFLEDTPHWRIDLKIHTDTIIIQLADVAWTISSRQHIALFHCFVGDVRVFVNVLHFGFVPEGLSDRTSVHWAISKLPKTMLDYLKLKIKHVYGHPTVYVGPTESRSYQPGQLRTDVVVINNPCLIQEFAFAAAGRLFIVEDFLSDFSKNVENVVLPGFGNLDTAGKFKTTIVPSSMGSGTISKTVEVEEELTRRHKTYFKVADIAFTPTHAAIMMEDSSIYLHSRSAYYKGLAFLASSKKDRLGALVKRRWCARTVVPKSSNMMVPAYSSKGNIVIIQVYSVEGTVKMFVTDPPASCSAQHPEFFAKSVDAVRRSVNESCIHQGDAVSRSDERGLPLNPNLSSCAKSDSLPINSSYSDDINPETATKYLMNQGKAYSGSDPHFPQDLNNVAIYKVGATKDDLQHYNKAFTFHVESAENDPKIPKILRNNGLQLVNNQINLHSVDFTPNENIYLIGVEFTSKEFSELNLRSLMVTALSVVNMPTEIFPISDETEEILDTEVSFPGVIIVRTKFYMVPSKVDFTYPKNVSYVTKIFPINTAVSAFVIDLGNVFVFATADSKYARPLTFYSREYIRAKLLTKTSTLEKKDRSPLFAVPGSSDLMDILVTEQGSISVLKRRSMEKIEKDQTQSIFIGSVATLDALREVRPFPTDEQIFQLATPDGEIVYGRFKTRHIYPECEVNSTDNSIVAVNSSCLVQHNYTGIDPFCVSSRDEENCTLWIYFDDKQEEIEGKTGGPYVVGKCPSIPRPFACIMSVNGTSAIEIPPDNSPNSELVSVDILGVPYHSLLNGNLELIVEETITTTGSSTVDATKLCPFTSFHVDFLQLDFAEVGFKTRLTAEISYRGAPPEAELLIEYENIPGIQVEIDSSGTVDKNQTTLTKTIDITFRLSNIDLYKMRNKKLKTRPLEQRNLGKESVSIFGLSIRPTAVNVRCRKEDFFTTIHFSTGCNPASKLRFVSEASPVNRNTEFKVDGDYLNITRDDVWHKQREKFECGNREAKYCRIPYAYLFKDNIFDLSWRDPFIPQFEQFLYSRSRKVTGNVVLYDLFGTDIIMNTTNLDSGCYHTAGNWYYTLLESTKRINGGDTSEQEDIYHYYVDCFDHSIQPRDMPKLLSSTEYRVLNNTNKNRIRFDVADETISSRRTKNRNQLLLFRAVVINTDFNRFTYCKLMDTFFLIRIVGQQAPRKGLAKLAYGGMVLGLVVFLGIVYFVFAYCYTWKLDVANLDTNPDEELLDEDLDDEYHGDKKFAREMKAQNRWKTAVTKFQALSKFKKTKKQRRNEDKNPTRRK